VIAWAAARSLVVKQELASPDAIVLLSGSATYMERANQAAKLFHAGRAPVVIVTDEKLISGWSNAEQRNPFFYELSMRELQRQGVPPARIAVIHDIGAGTYQECERIREYATQHDLKRLLIVTSGYHSRRALWAMERTAGTNLTIGIDSAPPGWQMPSPATWWLSRWGWKSVAGEYVKIAYYRLRY
jgi:uncharacterized SAM-binding protein YcdF (DUF218 family)